MSVNLNGVVLLGIVCLTLQQYSGWSQLKNSLEVQRVDPL